MSVSYPLSDIHITSSYGSRKNPFTGEKSFHSGLDLRADHIPVMAMFDGRCEQVGYDDISGKFVKLRHGEYTISYCHLSKVVVKEGDEVLAGETVAVSGNTGRATGPHLHVSCKHLEDRINPYTLFIYIREVRAEAAKALSTFQSSVVPSISQVEFLQRYAVAAMEQQKKYGIPSSVILSQMAYESGWGTSKLAREGNNYFGIKCSSSWLANGKPYSLHNDDRPNEKFCNYASVEESIEHHSLFLLGKRYQRCWNYPPTDYHHWLVEIKRAGYATARNYVSLCERIIKQYQLYKYDQMASSL